jgi:hypothetical protein
MLPWARLLIGARDGRNSHLAWPTNATAHPFSSLTNSAPVRSGALRQGLRLRSYCPSGTQALIGALNALSERLDPLGQENPL